jgi:hypothetical protein
MDPAPTTIRDALEAAVPADDDSSPVAPAAPDPAGPESADPEPFALSEPEGRVEQKEAAPAAGRDATGKFKKKGDAEPQPSAPTAEKASPSITPGPKSEPKAQPSERAPASWRPDVREHWAALPSEVRAEVARREQEVQRTLQETAEARKFTEQLQNVIRPYEMFIKAENSNPLQAIDNLMATAARLRTGTAPELAQMVAGIVKQFGVGRFGKNFIEQLDTALVGEVPASDPVQSQVQQVLQQQLAPVQQFMSQFQQAQAAQQQQAAQAAQGEVESFLAQAEFANDVREDMADLMEVAQRRGRDLSLQDAYRQACVANPRVRGVLEARAKTKGVQQLTGAAQKARAAAVSVSGSPALSTPPGGAADIRTAIESAIAMYDR